MSFINRLSQAVTIDSANSFSGTIVAGTTWNTGGTGTSTTGVNSIQVTVGSNKNLTVFVDQGRTNSSFQITDSYNFNAIKGNFGITVQAVGQFVRVRAKNIDGTDATVTIDTLLCPIVDSVPRSLDAHGHFQTAVNGLGDEWGNEANISPNGMLAVEQPYRLVGTTFGAAIDTSFWTATNSGTGSAAGVANSKVTISSGTATNAYGNIVSVRSGRFIFANPNKYRGIIRMTNLSQANTVRRWGAFTTTGTPPAPVDGHYFELSATNVLSVNCINAGGTPDSASSGSFNGDVAIYTMDTNAHAYEIVFYLASVQFYVDGVLLHTHTPTTALLASTETLPVQATAIKSANQADNATMEMWAGTIHRLGRNVTSPKFTYIHGAVTAQVLKSGPGTLRNITCNGNGTSATLFDALSATNTIAIIQLSANPVTLPYELDFFTGLTITTVGAGADVTVVYE